MSSNHLTKPPVVLPKPPAYKDSNAAARLPLKPPPKALVIPSSSSRYPKKKKRQRRRSCCRTSCCCTFIVILILTVSFLLAGGFFYLWYDPKAPVFHLQSFRFTQFNVSASKEADDGLYLDVSTESRVELKNPNQKLGLYYGSSQVYIRLLNVGGDEIDLGSKTLPGFTQEKRNATSLKVVTPLTHVELVGGDRDREVKKLKSDVQRKLLRVTVEVRTKLGIKLNDNLRIGSVVVIAKCKNVQLKRIQVEGFMPKCSIHLWDWP